MKSESNIKTHGMDSYKKGKEPGVIEASLDGVTYPIVIGSGLGGIAERISSITESKRVFILCDSFFKEGYCLQLETDLKKNGFEVWKKGILGVDIFQILIYCFFYGGRESQQDDLYGIKHFG